jgi:hypothetical protein
LTRDTVEETARKTRKICHGRTAMASPLSKRKTGTNQGRNEVFRSPMYFSERYCPGG